MNRQQRVLMLFALLLISAVVLGCARNDRVDESRASSRQDVRVDTPEYERALLRARASIAEAEQSGAAQYGNAELAMARDKMRAAEEAVEDGDVERAQRLAAEADLDADLAAAITRNRETQALVGEVRAGLQTLEDELRRNERVDVPRP